MSVRAKILIAFSAWLLGAVTATGGCLMAVSLLGDGFGVSGSSSQQLTIAAVNKALAAARQEPSPARSGSPSRASRARRRHLHAAQPTQSAAGAGTVFSSPAGTVVAVCESAGAYLLSWSPAQGYAVQQVHRGPAPVAIVVFAATQEVTMKIDCRSGTPVNHTSGGGDNGNDQ
jgi:hypothetical protein